MNNLTEKIKNKISISIIPFIFLLLIGLIKGNFTYFQKVYKTLIILLFNFSLLIIFFIVNFKNKNKIIKNNKYFLFFIFYLIYILFQFMTSYFTKAVNYDVFYYLSNYIFLIIFSNFFFLYINKLKDIKNGILLINLFLIIVLLWSLKDYISSGRNLSIFRPELSFGNTNYFAGYIIGLLPLAFIAPFIFYNKKRNLNKNYFSIILFIIFLIGLIPLYFTQTRAALFGCYLGIFSFLIPSIIIIKIRFSKKIKILLFISASIFFIIFPIILLKLPISIFQNTFKRISETMSNPIFFLKDRFNAWTGALNNFKKYPVSGAGLGSTYPASFKFIDKYYYIYSQTNSFKHSHSEYVEILGESGLIGICTFLVLTGYILISLIKNIFSTKYKENYRIICLGVSAGLISMLLHQIFSLTLRISVTMTAFFALLGIGIFLISYSKEALIIEKKDIKNNKINYLKKIKIPYTYFLSIILFIVLIINMFFFLPIVKSEYYLYKAVNTYSPEIKEKLLKKAIKYNPANIYAWTKKWNYDFDNLNYQITLSKDKNNIEYLFRETENDLKIINSIIPDYQNIWLKYTNLSLIKYKYEKINKLKDIKNSKKLLITTLYYLNKSLDIHFLQLSSHLKKLVILGELNNEKEFKKAIKNYIEAKIYLEYSKHNKIIKENIIIEYGDKNSFKKMNKKHYFKFRNRDIEAIHFKTYKIAEINNYYSFRKIFDKEISNLIQNNLNE